MDGIGWLFVLILACSLLLIFYAIIKSAVRNGILEADYIREQKKQEQEKANIEKSNNLQDSESTFVSDHSTNHSSKDDEQIKY